MSVKDKVVLVTGGSRGLGRAIAEAFLSAGAHVIALGRDPKALEETRTALADIGGSFEIATLDVRDEEAVTAFIGARPQLDCLVNNAGIARLTPFPETSTDELREILDVNVVGAFVVMRESVRKMLEGDGGLVINIASDGATKGIPRMAPYVGSKHALLGIGRSVREELRSQGIRVTTYCPGPIATDIMGPGTANPDVLMPDELAKTIVHLATLDARVEVPEVLVLPMPPAEPRSRVLPSPSRVMKSVRRRIAREKRS